MALSGKKLEPKRRRGELTILVVSLLLAFFIWLAHNLTQDYFSYRQFRVIAVTSLPGYASESEAQEILSLGGQSKGFDIIKYRKNSEVELPVRIDQKLFTADPSLENTFYVNARDIQKALAEAIDTDFELTSVPDQKLTFVFVPQSFRKVPVAMPDFRLTFAPQYMQVGDIELEPDSVLVYGNAADLEGLQFVEANPVHLQNLKKTTGGRLFLREMNGFRYGEETLNYKVRVERYVELKSVADVSVIDVPSGVNVMTFPAHLKVTCRVPYSSAKKFSGDDLAFEVRYEDVVAAHSSKIVPVLVSVGDCPIFSYETEPALVDCIISEHKQ